MDEELRRLEAEYARARDAAALLKLAQAHQRAGRALATLTLLRGAPASMRREGLVRDAEQGLWRQRLTSLRCVETVATFRTEGGLPPVIHARGFSTALPRLLDFQLGAWPPDLGCHPLSPPDDPAERWNPEVDPGLALAKLARCVDDGVTEADRARLAARGLEPMHVSRSQDGLSARMHNSGQAFRLALDAESGALDLDSFEGFGGGGGGLGPFGAIWHPHADVVAFWPSDAWPCQGELELVGLTGLPVAKLPRGSFPVGWVSETALLILTPIELRPPTELVFGADQAWRVEIWRPSE